MDNIAKAKLLIIAVCLSALLAACSEEAAKTERAAEEVTSETAQEKAGEQITVAKPSVLTVGEQNFKIFSYYQAFSHYIKLAKINPGSLEDSYAQAVTQPFRKNAFGEGKGIEYMSYWFFTPPQDIIPLQSELQALSDRENSLHAAIEEAVKKSAETLPGSDKTVHIFPANPAYTHGKTKELNIPGVALDQDVIVLFVTSTLLEEELQHTVAHEYFHMIDIEKGTAESSASTTLLESAVMEGKAEAFARMNYPETKLDWMSNADEKITEKTKVLFLNEKDSTEIEIWNDFYSGNTVAEVPPFASHIIGYEIMQSFLANHPDMPVAEWLTLTASEILAGSDYAVLEKNSRN